MTDGGMSIANVPDAAVSPAAVCLSKPASVSLGRASIVSRTTEAPTIPDDAANSTLIANTDKPIPAALPPTARWAAFNERSATPDSSSSKPMKINIGTATSSQLDKTFA